MESIIKDQLVKHLDVNGLLADSQHGFRSKRSCQTNLLAFTNEMSKLLDERKCVDVLYLDYAKAFDTISINSILKALRFFNVGNEFIKWIKVLLLKEKVV